MARDDFSAVAPMTRPAAAPAMAAAEAVQEQAQGVEGGVAGVVGGLADEAEDKVRALGYVAKPRAGPAGPAVPPPAIT